MWIRLVAGVFHGFLGQQRNQIARHGQCAEGFRNADFQQEPTQPRDKCSDGFRGRPFRTIDFHGAGKIAWAFPRRRAVELQHVRQEDAPRYSRAASLARKSAADFCLLRPGLGRILPGFSKLSCPLRRYFDKLDEEVTSWVQQAHLSAA